MFLVAEQNREIRCHACKLDADVRKVLTGIIF
jgi:hypothetical protein